MSEASIRIPDQKAIQEAVTLLKSGELVAFPTETVYGLGADAQNLEAIERLYKAKGRPSNHPVIVHLAGREQLDSWCSEIPEQAELLAKAFWPGPLTLVLNRSGKAKDAITGGQNTVAVRVPNHKVALDLLGAFGDGLIAPSANKFGNVSPTVAVHVAKEFADEVQMVLDGGACQVGIESTIVDASGQNLEILRPGMISAQQIAECLGIADWAELKVKRSKVRVSGDLPRHYAPRTPLKLVSAVELVDLVQSGAQRYAVMSFIDQPAASGVKEWIKGSPDHVEFARSLYANLRKLDLVGADCLLVEKVPDWDAWAGVKDRLKRAGNAAE